LWSTDPSDRCQRQLVLLNHSIIRQQRELSLYDDDDVDETLFGERVISGSLGIQPEKLLIGKTGRKVPCNKSNRGICMMTIVQPKTIIYKFFVFNCAKDMMTEREYSLCSLISIIHLF
jgi:hypothetical protein